MKLPAYMPIALELLRALELRPGQVIQVDVHHDAGCAMLAGLGICDCAPLVAVRGDGERPGALGVPR